MTRTPKSTEPEQEPQADGDAAAVTVVAVDSEAVQAALDAATALAEEQAAKLAELEEAVRLANEALDATNNAVAAGETLILSQQAEIVELKDQVASKDARIAELEEAAAAMATALEAAGVVAAAGAQPGEVIDGAHITAISGETIEVHYNNQTRILPLGMKASAVAGYRGGPVRLTLGRNDETGAVVVTTIERAE